ncbi:glycosyltransferase [Streptomyces sp. MUM 203J]|uniref:glycosyltransferase family 2 protein n=1 Tax=Streptomyces sp. MUM 203J TaxID=2791990 RepID=UPI001F048651|nr:glycosyltransferase family 2 protein [Streptomyces sp. MUM 203J]MCH0540344.1 glycosyltransferase [Streptomyces sp. MUM 203J]
MPNAHREALHDTVVVIPARDEEAEILGSLESLAAQTHRPDLVLVVVNNSTDGTQRVAQEFATRPGVPPTRVLSLPHNPHKKAGALNHGLTRLAEQAGSLEQAARFVLVMDADTSLHPEFLARARLVMDADPGLGGVSATCYGRGGLWRSTWQRYLAGMQIIEYGRYAHTRARSGVHTMAGAGSFYRTAALQQLVDARGEVFWQHSGNLVEDYETTLALKESGWRVTANQYCVAYTDLMPRLRDLVRQRERWVRGTLDIMRQRGWTRHTRLSIVQYVLGLLGFAYSLGWIAVWAGQSLQQGSPAGDPLWLAILLVWSLFSALRVAPLGWKAMLVCALLLPELVFQLIRTYWMGTSLWRSYTSGTPTWA